MRNYTVGFALATILLVTGTGFVVAPPAPYPNLRESHARVYTTNSLSVGWASTMHPALASPLADYSTIDRYARSAPESQARSMASLAKYLTAPARSELAKARVIYSWIVSHIRYDEGAYGSGTYFSEADYANRAFQSRRTVCTGFALLYKYMLRQVGIDAANIKGYSRTDDATAGQPTGPVDHEWNAIKIDGDWYLVDPTWAVTTAKRGKVNDHYFLTDPQAFVAQHLPADSRWQLLSPPVPKTTFDRFPKLYESYFELGFDSRFPQNGLIRTGDVATITLHNPNDMKIICSSARAGYTSTAPIPSTLRREGNTYTLTVRVPQRGTSTLFIFAKPRQTANEPYVGYQAIGSFTVIKG